MTEDEDAVWMPPPLTKQERCVRLIGQLKDHPGQWMRMPRDITTATVKNAAAYLDETVEVATRKRDGESRVYARIREQGK